MDNIIQGQPLFQESPMVDKVREQKMNQLGFDALAGQEQKYIPQPNTSGDKYGLKDQYPEVLVPTPQIDEELMQ